MVKNPDARYFNGSGQFGLWSPEQPPRGEHTRLTYADLSSLAVQSPYLLMLPQKGGSYSIRNTPAGDELPGILLLLRIALYSAWWRELRGVDDDKKKSHQNKLLSFALSGGDGDANAHTARQQLFDAVVRSNQSKFSPELKDYVGRTGSQGFFKNWTSSEMKTMALSNSTVDSALVPLWVQGLIDKDSVMRKNIFTPRSTSATTLSMGTPRRLRVHPSDVAAPNKTSRGPDRFPWKHVNGEAINEPPKDVNFVLGREWPKRNRTLVPASDLCAHIEFTGWSYPEFEATSRGKYSFDQLRDLDAAGLPRKGNGRSVVASEPGVFARSFHRLDKRDFQTSLDNFQVSFFFLTLGSRLLLLYPSSSSSSSFVPHCVPSKSKAFRLRGWVGTFANTRLTMCCFRLPPLVRRSTGGVVSQRLNSHDTATVFAPRSSRRPGTCALHDGDSHCCQKAAVNAASNRKGFLNMFLVQEILPVRVSG